MSYGLVQVHEEEQLSGPQWCQQAMGSGLGLSATQPVSAILVSKSDRQQSLWQDFLLHPSDWQDCRQEKKNSQDPDFRHKRTKEALWLGHRKNPPATKSQLAMWDPQLGVATRGSGDSFISNSKHGGAEMSYLEDKLVEEVEALDRRLRQGLHLDSSVIYRVLQMCITQKNLLLGGRLHTLTVRSGYQSNAFLANHFIRFYASHGRLEEAMHVFSSVSAPNTHMWASILLAHAERGKPATALQMYRQMRESGVRPNNYLYVAVLKACARAADLAFGREIHGDLSTSAVEPDVFVCSCLVDMYAKCGSLQDARRVFDSLAIKNVVTWTVMISAYAERGLGQEALALFDTMQHESIVLADTVTYVCLLKACGSVGSLHQGRQLHAQIQDRGLEHDVVIGSCLVDMYAKCGRLVDARSVFDNLPTRNVITWNSMLGGYADDGLGREALSLYAIMQQDRTVVADSVTFLCLLKACTTVGALKQGRRLHHQIRERGLDADAVIGSGLIDMYAKCGSLLDAQRVFDRIPAKTVATWNALLSGCAQNSDGQMAMRCFGKMQQQQVQPNEVTFVCLLNACSHEGLVNEGKYYFRLMLEDHNIKPSVHHYTCMVDLLARSGHLDEAENLLRSLPSEKGVVGWTSLMSACKSHGDLERGERCFQRLTTLEPETSTAFVLLGNMYANAGRWRDVDRLQSLRKSVGVKKKAAKACVEVKDMVHEFTVGEERADISAQVRTLNLRSREGGHVPHTELVLKSVAESEKENALCGHAEKLALAYGLLNSAEGTTLLVTKNLRMCSDCHNSTKVMSSVEKREIVVRDAHRVHRFRDGFCSCSDRH